MKLYFTILMLLCLKLSSAQVPHVEPNYVLNVMDWWQIHPMNPEGINYQPKIESPQPVIELKSGQSINAAIAKLPSTGGTIILGPGNYRSFQIIGRSNIHLIAEGNVVINHACSLAVSADFLEKELGPYNIKNNYYFHNRESLQKAYDQPPRNLYFKGLIFDGENKYEKCLAMVRVSDVVFDECVFLNYTNEANPTAIYKFIVGHYLSNVWFHRCQFAIKMTHVATLQYCHGCGFLECIMGKNISSGIGFSDDYFIMVKNIYYGRGSALAMAHSNVIIKDNIRHGNVNHILEISEPVFSQNYANEKRFHWEHGLDIHVLNNRVCYIEDSIVNLFRNKPLMDALKYDFAKM